MDLHKATTLVVQYGMSLRLSADMLRKLAKNANAWMANEGILERSQDSSNAKIYWTKLASMHGPNEHPLCWLGDRIFSMVSNSGETERYFSQLNRIHTCGRNRLSVNMLMNFFIIEAINSSVTRRYLSDN